MAENLASQPPLLVPMLENNGTLSRAWAIWFRDLYKRTSYQGGNAIDDNQQESIVLGALSSNAKKEERITSELERAAVSIENSKLLKKIESLEAQINTSYHLELKKKIELLENTVTLTSGGRNKYSKFTITNGISIVSEVFKTSLMTITGRVLSVPGNNLTLNSGNTTSPNPMVAPVMVTTAYSVSTLPAAGATPDGIITVSDEVGGYTLAFSDGTNWRRATDLAIVS